MVYSTTSTVAGWTDIFTSEIYKKTRLESITYCQQSQGLKIQARVLMTIHLHTICNCKEGYDLGLIGRNIKRFTAMKLIDAIINHSKESRKEDLLHTFAREGKKSSSKFKQKFCKHVNHPVLLDSTSMYNQRLNYLHWNPVTAGFVRQPWHWMYNSGIAYFTEKKGLLDIIILDGF